MTALIEVRAITVRFGGVTALDGVSIGAAEGELLGLIGPNGAGKTTLLRTVTGVVRPAQGQVLLRGHRIDDKPTHMRVRAGLGLSQQLVRPFRAMSVLDNVALTAGSRYTRSPIGAVLRRERKTAREKAREMLELVGIADAANALPDTLPLGYLKRLEVARALALRPAILLLDEPLAGLNHAEATQMADTILALNQGGLTILLIEHNLGEVLRICGRLVVLDNGRLIADGAPQQVMSEPAVRAAYLGQGMDDAAA